MPRKIGFIDANGADQDVSPTNPLPVAGAGTPGSPVGGVSTVQSIGYTASASFTRPNNVTAYPALAVQSATVAAVLVFANIGPAGGGKILITRVTHRIDVAAKPSGMIGHRLHLFNAAPTAIADGTAFNVPAADRDKYIGFVEAPEPLDLGDTLWADTEAMYLPVRMEVTLPALAAGSLWGIPQTIGGYTPTALAVKNWGLHSVLVG
jgi:hypothetical protein